MATDGNYYALTLTVNGASTAAYYSITPTSDLEFDEGGATITPSKASSTMVNVYTETIQLQSPAGSINAGATIVTNAQTIAGRVLVSPPVDVAVVVTLYGAGGKQLGQAILDPGVGDQIFSFSVSGTGDAIPKQHAPGVLRGLVPPATP